MPFTPAHAAAALPLRGIHLGPSALVVGTLAPDFEYFLRFAPDRGFGHSLRGCFVLTLPLALLVLWVFHRFVKIPLGALLPDSIQRRLGGYLVQFRFGGGKRFSLIVVSILLKMATHVVWDSFTHPGTWPYQHWLLLRQAGRVPIMGFVPVYKVLQHGSTVLGLGVLSLWFWAWFTHTKPSDQSREQVLSPKQKMRTSAAVLGVALLGALGRAVWGVGVPANPVTFKRFVGEAIVTLIALAWWQLVIYGVISRNTSRARSEALL